MPTEATESHQISQQRKSAVELKGSVFTLPILQLRSTSIGEIEIELSQHLSKALKFFQNAPVVIDLEAIQNAGGALDFSALLKLLSKQALIPVGVRNGSSQQNALAVSAGLAILKGGPTQEIIKKEPVLTEVASSRERKAEEQARVKPKAEKPAQARQTKIIKNPIRSGQQVYARDSDLVILAPVSPGAEIIADGSIHIYAPMRGRALAGVMGNVEARIFCQNLQAELIAIAGNFRVFEDQVPTEYRSKPVQIYLQEEHLVISPL